MSAYVVSDTHINALVSWASDGPARRYAGDASRVEYYWSGERRKVCGNEARIASVLYAENVRSVNARYQEHQPAHGFRYSYTRGPKGRPFSPVEIIRACHGYEYQACEADGWEESEAHAIIRAIERYAMRALPGYDDAAWEILPEMTA